MQFVDVFIRQAHPGERRGAYERGEEKVQEARQYQRDEALPWPVLVDDYAGTTHQTYGNMSDPVYLIDADGQVAFYGMWTHVPTLKQALDTLLAGGGRSTPGAQHIDHMLHLFASFVNGWHALQRGGRRAVIDYEIGTPGAATLTFLGHVAKPVLAPIALRATPLPRPARLVLGSSVAIVTALVIRAFRNRDEMYE